METIFKSALSHIRTEEQIRKNTEEYLISRLSAAPSVPVYARPRRFRLRRAVLAFSTAVLLCGAGLSAYAYYRAPASYLSVDINPSVELGVNAFGRVVSAVGYNSDGTLILRGQHVLGNDVRNAVAVLVKAAAGHGFLKANGSTVIALTSESDSKTTAKHLKQAALQGAKDALRSEGGKAVVQEESVSLKKRDDARKLDITPGKLNLIKTLQTLDPSIQVSDYKNTSVTDIMKKLAALRKAAHASQKPNTAPSGAASSENSSSAVSSRQSAAVSSRSSASSSRGESSAGKSTQKAQKQKSKKKAIAKPKNHSSGKTSKASSHAAQKTAGGVSERQTGNKTSKKISSVSSVSSVSSAAGTASSASSRAGENRGGKNAQSESSPHDSHADSLKKGGG